MPTPPNSGLRNLRDSATGGGLIPLVPSRSFVDNIPSGYTSPDVIDLRNAPHHPMMDRISGLVQAVKDDYHQSFPSPMTNLSPLDPGLTSRANGTDAATMEPPQQALQRRVVR